MPSFKNQGSACFLAGVKGRDDALLQGGDRLPEGGDIQRSFHQTITDHHLNTVLS